MFLFTCSDVLMTYCFVFFSGELVALTTRFTDELMSQGLTKRILTLVSEISVTQEFERLQRERGLGNEKHRKEVGAITAFKKKPQLLSINVFISLITIAMLAEVGVCT